MVAFDIACKRGLWAFFMSFFNNTFAKPTWLV